MKSVGDVDDLREREEWKGSTQHVICYRAGDNAGGLKLAGE